MAAQSEEEQGMVHKARRVRQGEEEHGRIG